MYKLLLILKYLRRKLAPMFAALAVTICTFMVIVVLSVMGGFLDLLRDSARKLTGDVVVSASLNGFPYYDSLIEEIEQLPEVAAATPVVRTFGAMNIASQTAGVQVAGIRPQGFDQIVRYRETLHWDQQDLLDDLEAAFPPEDRQRYPAIYQRELERRKAFDPAAAALTMELPEEIRTSSTGRDRPAAVIGIETNPLHWRDAQGHYDLTNAALGGEITLTVFPLTQAGVVREPTYESFVVANEFKSGLYDVDANVVFVPFDVLQRMLDMQQTEVREGFDPVTGEGGEVTIRPARASEVLVKAAPGFTADQAAVAVEEAVNRWLQDHPDIFPPRVRTWEQVHEHLISAVKNETGLVTFLFAVISLVAVVMVATTFYMIVLEKTRDIGILRAIGASRAGIRHVFLGYGLAIGIVGSLAGLGLALLVVTNLNEIQDFLARTIGWRMWDPRTYFFDRIPDEVDPVNAVVIVLGAILSSVVGALIPAFLAARQDPIEALRYE